MVQSQILFSHSRLHLINENQPYTFALFLILKGGNSCWKLSFAGRCAIPFCFCLIDALAPREFTSRAWAWSRFTFLRCFFFAKLISTVLSNNARSCSFIKLGIRPGEYEGNVFLLTSATGFRKKTFYMTIHVSVILFFAFDIWVCAVAAFCSF